MHWTDVFVGSVAIILGVVALGTSVLNWEAGYSLPKVRSIERRFGRRGARIFYAGLGALLIILGCAIVAGFGPNT